jgi:hypothetical protein
LIVRCGRKQKFLIRAQAGRFAPTADIRGAAIGGLWVLERFGSPGAQHATGASDTLAITQILFSF